MDTDNPTMEQTMADPTFRFFPIQWGATCDACGAQTFESFERECQEWAEAHVCPQS